MIVVADPSDGFSPLPVNKVLFPLSDEHNYSVLQNLLQSLAGLFSHNASRVSCFGAAVTAAHHCLEEKGGRIFLMSTSICGVGQGKLEDREDSKIAGTPEETKLFGPQDSFYQILATKMAENYVSCDMFIGANSYVDLATTSNHFFLLSV